MGEITCNKTTQPTNTRSHSQSNSLILQFPLHQLHVDAGFRSSSTLLACRGALTLLEVFDIFRPATPLLCLLLLFPQIRCNFSGQSSAIQSSCEGQMVGVFQCICMGGGYCACQWISQTNYTYWLKFRYIQREYITLSPLLLSPVICMQRGENKIQLCHNNNSKSSSLFGNRPNLCWSSIYSPWWQIALTGSAIFSLVNLKCENATGRCGCLQHTKWIGLRDYLFNRMCNSTAVLIGWGKKKKINPLFLAHARTHAHTHTRTHAHMHLPALTVGKHPSKSFQSTRTAKQTFLH